jgi:hypothetical protein
VRFFAVGLAWGAPFVALAFVNTNPGAAVYPALVHLFGPVQWPLVGAAPFLAVVGIVVTACLASPAPRGARRSWLLWPLLLLVTFAANILLSFSSLSDSGVIIASDVAFMAVGLLIVILVLGVVLTTAWTFWRHRRWLGALWLVVWLSLNILFGLAGAQHDADFGGALLAVLVGGAVLVMSLVAGLAASLLVDRKPRPRPQADCPAPEDTWEA